MLLHHMSFMGCTNCHITSGYGVLCYVYLPAGTSHARTTVCSLPHTRYAIWNAGYFIADICVSGITRAKYLYETQSTQESLYCSPLYALNRCNLSKRSTGKLATCTNLLLLRSTDNAKSMLLNHCTHRTLFTIENICTRQSSRATTGAIIKVVEKIS